MHVKAFTEDKANQCCAILYVDNGTIEHNLMCSPYNGAQYSAINFGLCTMVHNVKGDFTTAQSLQLQQCIPMLGGECFLMA